MDIDVSPQDSSKSYRGLRNVIYGTQNGRYCAAASTGWDTESYATEQAAADLAARAGQALAAVQAGQDAPLYYYMPRSRYDETSLAQAAGIWRWRLRRHFRPEIYFRLPERILRKYARAFGLDAAELKKPLSEAALPFHEN